MKKIISCAAIIAMVMSLSTFAFAEEGFSVKNSTEKLSEDYLSMNISMPYFEGFKAADEINRKIDDIVARSVGDARTAARYMKEFDVQRAQRGEGPLKRLITLDTTYDWIKNGDILSIQYDTDYYSGGAHPTTTVNAITANTAIGEIYTFKSLFKENSDYASYITSNILETIEKGEDFYFKGYDKTINNLNGDYKFYIDGNKLVIYFDLYQIAPYAAGIQHFVFDAEDLKPLLKDEVYNSIKDAKPMSGVRNNGISVETSKKSYVTPSGVMVPLRAVAETLGYKVDWSEKDGAIVDGGSIKEDVNSYWRTGKEPISLIPPVVTDGVTYVPLQYFKEVLDENISIGYYKYTYISDKGDQALSDWVVRTYAKSGYNNLFNKLIFGFKSPKSEEECAFTYAEAVKSRNGAIQYSLLTDKLKVEQYNFFKDLNFVTGTSSPWIDSYGISKIEDGKYKIVFNWKTSAPSPMTDTITYITIVTEAGQTRISSLESNK